MAADTAVGDVVCGRSGGDAGTGEARWPEGLRLYAAQVAAVVPPEPDEARDLLARARQGDERARDRMTLRHLGLVLDAVRDAGPARGDAFRLLEEGNLALAEAVRDFPPDGGGDFRGYASTHVRQALARLTCPAS
jgi:DNA-directed RNA polymerase sigma subunit (sigma70/sigma32)